MPLGRSLFSRLVCFNAPYFATISPRFEELRPGYACVSMRKRRAITNHIGTVHAIAMCNLAELAAGTMTEVSIPPTMRWLPKGMKVDYLRKAESDVRAVAIVADIAEGPAREVPVVVEISDADGLAVCRAAITMWVSPRRAPLKGAPG
ncbi:MAG TPA: hotdog fold domain-containing protein [Usitatibacter sp.]|nr:hotdog fold domain-containing protein [Usitatibacter sp.]